jgi:hypothetical protein
MKVYTGTCPLCRVWLQSTTPSAQKHYDTCHDGLYAPRGVLA